MKARILYGEKKEFVLGEKFNGDKRVTSIEVKEGGLHIHYESTDTGAKGRLEFYNTPFVVEECSEGETALDDLEKAFL